jgi:hypothetical protein
MLAMSISAHDPWRSWKGISFDHIVGASQQFRRYGEAEHISCFEIESPVQLEWEVSRLGAVENFSDIDPSLLG